MTGKSNGSTATECVRPYRKLSANNLASGRGWGGGLSLGRASERQAGPRDPPAEPPTPALPARAHEPELAPALVALMRRLEPRRARLKADHPRLDLQHTGLVHQEPQPDLCDRHPTLRAAEPVDPGSQRMR